MRKWWITKSSMIWMFIFFSHRNTETQWQKNELQETSDRLWISPATVQQALNAIKIITIAAHTHTHRLNLRPSKAETLTGNCQDRQPSTQGRLDWAALLHKCLLISFSTYTNTKKTAKHLWEPRRPFRTGPPLTANSPTVRQWGLQAMY